MFSEVGLYKCQSFYCGASLKDWDSTRAHILRGSGDIYPHLYEMSNGTELAILDRTPWPGPDEAIRISYSFGCVYGILHAYMNTMLNLEDEGNVHATERMTTTIDRTIEELEGLRYLKIPMPSAQALMQRFDYSSSTQSDFVRKIPLRLRSAVPLIMQARPALTPFPVRGRPFDIP